MRLVDENKESFLDKRVKIEMSVKELLSFWAVFGNLTASDFDEHLKVAYNEELTSMKNLLKLILEKQSDESDIVYNICDDLSDIFDELLKSNKI